MEEFNMIKIITDSTSDLSTELYEQLGAEVLPLGVTFGDEHFIDGVNIDTKKIYEMVSKTGKLPKTSAVNIVTMSEAFEKHLENGDEVIFVPISSEFSSNYSTAVAVSVSLKEIYGDHIRVVDSRSLSSGIGLQLFPIRGDIDKGLSLEEVYQNAMKRVDCVNAEFVVDTMEYLYKGGRCSGLSYFFGRNFHLHPVIRVEKGKMVVHKLTRGKKLKGIDFQIEEFKKQLEADNVILDNIFITHSLCDGDDKYMYDIVSKVVDPSIIKITTAGSIVASHCGFGTIGLLYITKVNVIE